MNIVVINPVGQGQKFTDCGGYKVDAGVLHLTNELGVVFMSFAPGGWGGVYDADEARKHTSQVAVVRPIGG